MIPKAQRDLLETIKHGKPCFLIGNGINLFNQAKNEGDLSWTGLLVEIYNDISPRKLNFIPKGISLTEFYDLLDLQIEGKVKKSLQKEFADKLNWEPKNHHSIILEKIKKYNAPILTTNFDFVLKKAINAKMYRYRIDGLRLLSDFYPWDSYFSTEEQIDPFNSFSIWHIHGQKNYERSIKLGLNQYLLMTDRAKRHLSGNTANIDPFSKYQTWLRPFFERDLIIFGQGLDEQEVFLRWLLVERAKYYKKFPSEARSSFYVNHNSIPPKEDGKQFFLKGVGFKYVNFTEGYNKFYEDFWNDI